MVFGEILEDMKMIYGLNDKISDCLHFCIYSITIKKTLALWCDSFWLSVKQLYRYLWGLLHGTGAIVQCPNTNETTFSASLAICAGNSPVPGEFPAQRPVTWSFDVFFDLHLNKRLSKQSWGWWFETPSRPLWRQRNAWRVHLWVREFNRSAMSCYSTTTRQRITKPRAYDIKHTLWHTANFTLKILPLLTPFEQHFIKT